MLKRALIVVAAVTLSACAATPATYARLDASPEQNRIDSTVCTHQSRTNASVPERPDRWFVAEGSAARSRYALGWAERAAQVQANMYDRCMTSKGYVRSA